MLLIGLLHSRATQWMRTNKRPLPKNVLEKRHTNLIDVIEWWFFLASLWADRYRTSYVCGPSEHRLIGLTVGQLLQQSADQYGDRTALVDVRQDVRKTYHQLLHDVPFSSFLPLSQATARCLFQFGMCDNGIVVDFPSSRVPMDRSLLNRIDCFAFYSEIIKKLKHEQSKLM